MPGLAPDTLRLDRPLPQAANDPGVIVEMAGDGPDMPDISQDGAILRIEHGDGSVTISLDGKPLVDAQKDQRDEGWFANLVDDIDPMEVGRISEELLRGISDDDQSRKEWIEAQTTGIQLLGITVEVPGLQGASDGAPVEGMSKVRHPLLLEAVLRFQANARSELLPTDGPVKVRDDSNGSTIGQDQHADALEQDLNHYLTDTAAEYYPDTDRMLLKLGFCGTAFKKVYFCPLRMRPVSETVDAADLIVSSQATDLANAKRVTHRAMLTTSTVARLKILGVYRDVDLNVPLAPQLDSLQRQEKAQQGVSGDSMNPEDRDREIYECYCELDIKGYEHNWMGKPSGLQVPYRVTLDVSSRQVLSIVRNYNKPQPDQLPKPRKSFVKYTFVPGLGFYDIGLLHILGNTTNALTAAWREMLDNGMYANFPGFLMADVAGRQNTNIFRVPPGGGAQVKTGGMPIGDAIMPLPYQTQGMAALMALTSAMEQDGQRVGGTSELPVGEGRQDAPVGTTLALIDQATKIQNSVHKRMHASQAEEFKLIVQCFREHPQSFWEKGCKSQTQWSEQMFLQALDSCDLVPQADPNTASHVQRMAKVQALNLWAAQNPTLADPIAIGRFSIQSLGFSDPDQFMAPPSAMGQPPPELVAMQQAGKVAQQLADAKTTEANAKTAKSQAEVMELKAKIAQGGLAAGQPPSPLEQATAKAKLMDAQTDRAALALKAHELQQDTANEAADRQSREKMAALDLAKEVMGHMADAEQAAREVKPIEREIGAT